MHTGIVPSLSHNLHGIVRLTTGFVLKITLTHGEIRRAQWRQMGAYVHQAVSQREAGV